MKSIPATITRLSRSALVKQIDFRRRSYRQLDHVGRVIVGACGGRHFAFLVRVEVATRTEERYSSNFVDILYLAEFGSKYL